MRHQNGVTCKEQVAFTSDSLCKMVCQIREAASLQQQDIVSHRTAGPRKSVLFACPWALAEKPVVKFWLPLHSLKRFCVPSDSPLTQQMGEPIIQKFVSYNI